MSTITRLSDTATNAIVALEGRAAARLKAAERLQEIVDKERLGLVREQLQEGIRALLIQQVEFLLMADKLRKQVGSVGAQARLI